jgi:hypothetical protein
MGTYVRFLFIALSFGSASLAADVATVIQQIRSTRLDPSRSVEIKGLKLVIGGGGALIIRSGVLVPATAIGSAPAEMVFLGDATIQISAPDEIEASQLELFTGSSKLSEDFEEGVLVFANDDAVNALLGRQHVDLAVERLSRAADLYQKWLAGAVRKQLSIEAILFADGVGDPFHRGFFSASVHSKDLGEFLYIHHPEWDEEITVGQFVPISLEKRAERRIRRELEREQRRGRLIGVRLEDLGQWDTWLSATIRNAEGKAISSVAGFEPRQYVLELDIADRSLRLSGKARIELMTRSGQRQVVRLQLHSDLVVHRVAAGGTPAPYFRSGPDLYVYLGSPPAPSESVSVTVEYSGELLEKMGRRTTALRDTAGWYPHAGTLDRARYDVTFRWPRGLGLLSAGKRVDGGMLDGRQWERRTLDFPSSAFSFEVGRFLKDTFQAGHVAVTVAYDPEGRSLDMEIREEIRNAVRDSLLYFEESYGRYPLDDLVVVTVPRDFSQSHLGFVTLSNLMMADFDVYATTLGVEDRRTVIAHEIAHQWWGHLVGWLSYRDQWFTEALANFSALQFSRKKLEKAGSSRLGPISGWQSDVLDTTEDGRTLESLGPLILGARLNSSMSDQAYEAVVYKKGAIVIDMLSRIYGDDNFDRILRSIVAYASNRAISTHELLHIIQTATREVDVQEFADQFIFGTGVPVIRYDYEFLPGENSTWTVKGVAKQYISIRFRYHIVFRDSRHEVVREVIPETRIEEWAMVVPFHVGVLSPMGGPKPRRSVSELQKEIGDGFVFGRLTIRGKSTPFEVDVSHEPRSFWLDRDKETLAQFYSPQTSPKLVLFAEAGFLAATGRLQEAEEKYKEIIRAPKTTEFDPDVQRLGSTIRKARLEIQDAALDAFAHVGIARIRLDQKQYSSVPAALQDARKAAGRASIVVNGEIGILEGRLHIEQGDYESGFRRLRKLLLGRSPASNDAEGFAWLAIAAKLTRHPKELEKALEAAQRKGVDTAGLN